MVQEILSTEPKKPDQALEFAIAFEKGVKRQRAYGAQAPESTKSTIKCDLALAVEKANLRKCYRCGIANFTMEHVDFCMATNHRCNFCKIVGHLENCCHKTSLSGKKR